MRIYGLRAARHVLPRGCSRCALINQTVNLLIATISHCDSTNRGVMSHFALHAARRGFEIGITSVSFAHNTLITLAVAENISFAPTRRIVYFVPLHYIWDARFGTLLLAELACCEPSLARHELGVCH